jgi:hypothetical protein
MAIRVFGFFFLQMPTVRQQKLAQLERRLSARFRAGILIR